MTKIRPPGSTALNATMRKFGAPETIIHQSQYWTVMLRPAQVTLWSLVLAANETAHAFSQLTQASFTELHTITGQLEAALAKAFSYDKLNYVMLMMVDVDVHFHVIPRYERARYFDEVEFIDFGWPGPPDLSRHYEIKADTNLHIINYIGSCWE